MIKHILLLLLFAAAAAQAEPYSHTFNVELAGVTDIYGDVSGPVDNLLEWSAISFGYQTWNRGYYLTFHAGPEALLSADFRQQLLRTGVFGMWLSPAVGINLQLDEPHGGDIYIGGTLSFEFSPSRRLGYYLFVRSAWWLNTSC